MAVTFTDSIVDDYLWSLERPMYLRYSKDADDSAAVVTIAITQGSYSKTLTLRYSGLIKAIEMNISNLVKSYFQHVDYAIDKGVLSNPTNSAVQYTGTRTQKVIVTITDDDGAINTTQFFVKNSNNDVVNVSPGVTSIFGADNFPLTLSNKTPSFNVPNGDNTPLGIGGWHVLNIPIILYNVLVTVVSISITRKKLDGTTISTESITAATIGDDKIVAIPIGNYNGDPGDVHPAGIEVTIDVYDGGGIIRTQVYTYNYLEKCDITRQKIIYYEEAYGGLNMLTFANNNKNAAKKSNDFVLQDGSKTRLNTTHRGGGSLISEYVDNYSNDFYTNLFLSDKIQSFLYDTIDLIDLLLTQKTHRIKQIDNTEMKQYTFAYEEVERLKY